MHLLVTVNFAANLPYEDKHSQGITWTTDPPMTGSEPCKKRGVLSMVPPDWADSAEIALTFAEEGTGWMFNLGDSPHNNGYGERFLRSVNCSIFMKYLCRGNIFNTPGRSRQSV